MPGKQMMLRRSTDRGRCSTRGRCGGKAAWPQGRAGRALGPTARSCRSSPAPAQMGPAQFCSLRSWVRALSSSGSCENSEEEEEEAFGFAMGAHNWRAGRRLRRGRGARITSAPRFGKFTLLWDPKAKPGMAQLGKLRQGGCQAQAGCPSPLTGGIGIGVTSKGPILSPHMSPAVGWAGRTGGSATPGQGASFGVGSPVPGREQEGRAAAGVQGPPEPAVTWAWCPCQQRAQPCPWLGTVAQGRGCVS